MKIKTRKMAAKRFKVSAGGKIMHRRQNSRHLKVHKSKRQLSKYKKSVAFGKIQVAAIKRYLPYA